MFDNDRHSATYGKSIAQYAYQLEPQADVAARIIAAGGTPPRPIRGRAAISGCPRSPRSTTTSFSCSSATTAASASTTPPARTWSGASASSRSTCSARPTSRSLAPERRQSGRRRATIVPVTQVRRLHRPRRQHPAAERQAGREVGRLAIGPRLKNGGHLILAGNDNDYSVTQQAGPTSSSTSTSTSTVEACSAISTSRPC